MTAPTFQVRVDSVIDGVARYRVYLYEPGQPSRDIGPAWPTPKAACQYADRKPTDYTSPLRFSQTALDAAPLGSAREPGRSEDPHRPSPPGSGPAQRPSPGRARGRRSTSEGDPGQTGDTSPPG